MHVHPVLPPWLRPCCEGFPTSLLRIPNLLVKDSQPPCEGPSQGGRESFTRRSEILHKEVGNPSQGGRESFTRRSGIQHKEVGNPSQGGWESKTRRLGILHKEVGNPSQGGWESFTRRSVGILHKEVGNPSQGGREFPDLLVKDSRPPCEGFPTSL